MSVLPGGPRDGLRFEGRYDGGNLFSAAQLYRDNDFEIHTKPDFPTNYHCQNFNFRVGQLVKGQKYQFKIMNFSKNAPPIQPIVYVGG